MIYSFAGDIAFYINDDWEIIQRLVDFRHLDSGDHKGKTGAVRFAEAASKRGALSKIGLIPHGSSSSSKLIHLLLITS